MAKRPVFIISKRNPFYSEIETDFQFFSGFAPSQKVKSLQSLHASFLSTHKDAKILEISSKSQELLGVKLSAFNLLFKDNSGKTCCVESAFQSSKCFENGKQYLDLKYSSPRNAKKDERIRNSGKIVKFVFDGDEFPLEPKTYFYDWLYINALNKNKELSTELVNYNAFTDIEFNPQKSINCQARTCAIFVSLVQSNLISIALQSKEKFLETVYGQPKNIQISMF